MRLDPATAPSRPDLAFLRRRSRPRPAAQDAAVADFIAGRATHHPHPRGSVPPPPAAPGALRPPTAPAAAPPPARSGADLLDLSPEPTSPSAAAPAASAPTAPAPRVHRDVRIRAGQQRLLTADSPTVTLTRVQSGIGLLEIEAVCSPNVGDLRLGAAYQLASGPTSTVQYAGGNRFAPSSRRPVIVAGRDEYEHLRIDVRQSRDLQRLAVYAFSESRSELSWGGTLVLSTFGGARVEAPLESLPGGRVAVLLTIYNLDGEFVVRAELETVGGDVREAARAYGFDRITWRDDRSPVD